MPKFNFVVRDSAGKTITGQLAMDSKEQLISRLKDQGYFINKISEVKDDSFYNRIDTAFQRLTPIRIKDISIFARLLSTMINAGLPILRSLKIIEKQTENLRLVEVIQSIRDQVEEGHPLSLAMSKHPRVFNPLIVAMTKSGEESGSLDIVLDRISHDLEREIEIRSRVAAGIRYPVIIMGAAVVIVTIVLIFVVPAFQTIFESMDAQLPLPTQVLVNISEVIRHSAAFVVLAIVILVIAYKYLSRIPSVAKFFDSIMLKLPVFGMLLRKIALARFARTLSILLRSGVPILRAMSVVEQTVGNAVIASAVVASKEAIREGERISPPLEETGEFPPMVIDMIAVGEETGALDTMLEKISEFYDQEVDFTIDAFTTLIEPVLIMFLGVVIGFIVVALYMPLFSVITQMTEAIG
ncbi:type II secretion system F family protein [bacterium]|nr:type II secretion system F family protein [bacterium]MBU1025627.1 type II secretion system F family protein [bacterium]